MPTKKNMDPKLVSSKQQYEPGNICRSVKDQDGKKVKVAVVKEVMVFLAKKRKTYIPGQMSRSRAQIYAELESRGYTVPRKQKK